MFTGTQDQTADVELTCFCFCLQEPGIKQRMWNLRVFVYVYRSLGSNSGHGTGVFLFVFTGAWDQTPDMELACFCLCLQEPGIKHLTWNWRVFVCVYRSLGYMFLFIFTGAWDQTADVELTCFCLFLQEPGIKQLMWNSHVFVYVYRSLGSNSWSGTYVFLFVFTVAWDQTADVELACFCLCLQEPGIKQRMWNLRVFVYVYRSLGSNSGHGTGVFLFVFTGTQDQTADVELTCFFFFLQEPGIKQLTWNLRVFVCVYRSLGSNSGCGTGVFLFVFTGAWDQTPDMELACFCLCLQEPGIKHLTWNWRVFVCVYRSLGYMFLFIFTGAWDQTADVELTCFCLFLQEPGIKQLMWNSHVFVYVYRSPGSNSWHWICMFLFMSTGARDQTADIELACFCLCLQEPWIKQLMWNSHVFVCVYRSLGSNSWCGTHMFLFTFTGARDQTADIEFACFCLCLQEPGIKQLTLNSRVFVCVYRSLGSNSWHWIRVLLFTFKGTPRVFVYVYRNQVLNS